jgi:hypothetical protein
MERSAGGIMTPDHRTEAEALLAAVEKMIRPPWNAEAVAALYRTTMDNARGIVALRNTAPDLIRALLGEVDRLRSIIDRADHTSPAALSAQWKACEEENDRLTAERERPAGEVEAMVDEFGDAVAVNVRLPLDAPDVPDACPELAREIATKGAVVSAIRSICAARDAAVAERDAARALAFDAVGNLQHTLACTGDRAWNLDLCDCYVRRFEERLAALTGAKP